MRAGHIGAPTSHIRSHAVTAHTATERTATVISILKYRRRSNVYIVRLHMDATSTCTHTTTHSFPTSAVGTWVALSLSLGAPRPRRALFAPWTTEACADVASNANPSEALSSGLVSTQHHRAPRVGPVHQHLEIIDVRHRPVAVGERARRRREVDGLARRAAGERSGKDRRDVRRVEDMHQGICRREPGVAEWDERA